MGINMIPLNRLETDLRGTLNECADSGETFVIELPDHRLIAIQVLDPAEDDSLTSDLLESNSSVSSDGRQVKS
jgi:hypothetical protein